jgi:23S rRNA (pseudouridine1915-N3)-methyltransferase
VLLPHSSFDGDRARQEESERILLRIKDGEYVVLLDERGENITSPALSARISDAQMEARRIVVVIGGAYGVDERVHARANFIWSLSKLVFPHQLVRLILAEQLYRAQEIARGGGYHHE